MAIKQLSDGNPDGTVLGQSATDLVGFFGKTARVQATFVSSLGTTSTTTSIKTAVNSIKSALVNLGLMASS